MPMPVRQVRIQATKKTERDPVTLPRMGPPEGYSVQKISKIAFLYYGTFSIFFFSISAS